MPLQKMLMCPPTYFDIEYSINPWMDTKNRVDAKKAAAQWQAVRDTLTSLGITVELIEAAKGLPDMTFAGDCGLAIGHKFLAANFRHPERQGEAEKYVRWFKNRGYEIIRLPAGIYFEGLGDIVHYDGDIIFGYGHRSSQESLRYVMDTFPHLNLLCELELTDESFYHAGIAISLIGKEKALYYPGAFTAESRQILAQQLEHAFPVSEYDATVNFVCNNITLKNKILMAGCSPELEEQLNNRGYEVIKCQMSEFKKSGASLRCLVLDIL